MPTIEKKTLLAIINPISGTTKKEYVPELLENELSGLTIEFENCQSSIFPLLLTFVVILF